MSAKAPTLLWPDLLHPLEFLDDSMVKLTQRPPSLVDYMYNQNAQTALIQEFLAELNERPCDEELVLIREAMQETLRSPYPLPLELTWYVLCILYVSAESMFVRLKISTSPSLLNAWFKSPDYYRARMESQLCGEFVVMGPGRARRGRVVSKCLTPVEIVAAAWAEIVFEVTKPADIVDRENNWNGRGRSDGTV